MPQQATLTGAQYQPPVRTQRGSRSQGKQGKGQTGYRVCWSIEGAAFRSWYEESAGFQLDETAANAAACNKVSKKQGVTEEMVRRVLERIQSDKWFADHNIVVTVQDLASDTAKYRWEYWYQLVIQTQRAVRTSKNPPTREQDPYSIAALLEEHNPGYHARKAEMEASSWIN